jgi:hypothetical protein
MVDNDPSRVSASSTKYFLLLLLAALYTAMTNAQVIPKKNMTGLAIVADVDVDGFVEVVAATQQGRVLIIDN